ncbi:MAG TPA: hypothetical protein VG347_15120 [Verrucomicrobiae bacterium]|nr:hypothetical protein [Verrucomicrobiae bacterium]
MLIAKIQFAHAAIGNAPKIISVNGSEGVQMARYFYGTGAPSATTLKTGNGKYNAAASGYVVSVSLVTGGAGYVVGGILTLPGGTGTTVQIQIDAVDAVGAILDFRVVRRGDYTVYPANPITASSGTATFNLNFPAPDYYADITTPTSPVFYVCTTSGSKSTSTWAPSGGGTQQFKMVSDAGDYWNCHTFDGTTTGSTLVKVAKPAKMRCTAAGSGGGAIGSETIRGFTYTYSYTAVTSAGVTIEYTRGWTSTDTNNPSGTDYMTPPVLVGDVIVAVAFTTLTPTSLVGVAWMYLGCQWATA